MKGTMKRIISILLALALVITSLNYTPKTVNAATDWKSPTGESFSLQKDGATTLSYRVITGSETGDIYVYGSHYMHVYPNKSATPNPTAIYFDEGLTTEGTTEFTGWKNIIAGNNIQFGFGLNNQYTNGVFSPDKYYSLRLVYPDGDVVFQFKVGNPAEVEESSSEESSSKENTSEESSEQEKQWVKVANSTTLEYSYVSGLTLSINPNIVGTEIQLVFDGAAPAKNVLLDGVEPTSYRTDGANIYIPVDSITGTHTLTFTDYYGANLTTIDFRNTSGGSTDPDPDVETISTVLKDAYVYNYVESGAGFGVGFKDPNADTYTAATGYTTTYYVVINGETLTVGKENKIDLSGLGLTEGTEYEAQMYAEYVSADKTVRTEKTSATKFVYKTTKTTAKNTGLAQIHFTSTGGKDAAYAGFYNGDQNNKPKIPSVITVINEDGTTDEADFGTANIRGNSTANAAKKPYNFKFNSKLDVQDMGKAKKWSLLANIFDKTLMRNQIGMDFQRLLEESRALGQVYTSECTPVDLYIDGKYAGTYTLIESVEVGSTRVAIDIDGIDEDTNEITDSTKATSVTIGDKTYTVYDVLLELGNDNRLDDECYYFEGTLPGGSANGKSQWAINEPAVGDDSTYDYAPTSTNKPEFVNLTSTYIQDFETALAANDYDTFSQFMDVDSFVDFYITSEYFMTKDIAFSSTRFYIKGGKIYAGPLWDLDLSSGNNGANLSAENFYAQTFEWFKALMANDTFKAKVIERFTELQPQIRSLYATRGKVDQAYDKVVTSANANYTEAYNTKLNASNPSDIGWGYGYIYGNGGFFNQLEQNLTLDQAYNTYGVYGSVDAYDNYEDYVTDYKEWLKARNEWLIEQWNVEEETGVKKDAEGDVKVIWYEVPDATSYTITYTPVATLETAEYNWMNAGISLLAAADEETVTLTAEEAAAAGYSYNFTDNGINLADSTFVTVNAVAEDGSTTEVVNEEVYAKLSLMNRVTVSGLTATITTEVTNSGLAAVENVALTLTDANGNAVDTKTVTVLADTKATVDFTRTEETEGDYSYRIKVGTTYDSGVAYTCDEVVEEEITSTNEYLTAAREGATYKTVGTLPDGVGSFAFDKNGYQVTTGATDQAIYIRLNGTVVAANETGNSAMGYNVNYSALEYNKVNEIQIEWVDRATDMTTLTTHVMSVYVKVGDKPAEVAPDVSAVVVNATAETAKWIQPTANNGATKNSAGTLNYYIESSYYAGGTNNKVDELDFFNGNIYGYYSEGTKVPYGGLTENPITGEAFGIASDRMGNGVDSVWISDGTTTTKMTEGTEWYHSVTNLDVLTISADRFVLAENETEKIYYVTVRLANGSDYTWPLKVDAMGVPEAVNGLVFNEQTKLVQWQASQNATSYNVYVNDVKINNTIDASYSLAEYDFSAEGTYTITVKAVNEAGESAGTSTTYVVEAEKWTVVTDSNNKLYYKDANNMNLVSVQKPDWASETGIYMHTSADPSYISINGVKVGAESFAKQGTGAVIYTSALTAQISTVEFCAADGSVIGSVVIKNVDGEVATTEAPTVAQPDIDIDAITDWIQLSGTSVSGATIWVSKAVANTMGNDGIRGFYDAGKSNNWHISEAFKKVDVFGFVTTGNATSIVIDGIEYSSDDVNVCFGSDCVYINQALVDAQPGETKYYKITATGTTTGQNGTFVVKVVGEEAPDVSGVEIPADNEWQEITNVTSSDGSTWYLPKAVTIISDTVRELKAKGSEVSYGGDGNNTLTDPVLGISLGVGTPASVWITDDKAKAPVKLTSDEVFINTNVISILQSKFAVNEGETKIFYLAFRNASGTDYFAPVKVVGPEPSAKWSDWTNMNDASSAATIEYSYATLSSNTLGVQADTRELPDTVIVVFQEGLASAKLDGTDISFNGAGVEIPKSSLVEGQEYILEVENEAKTKTASVKIKYVKAKDYKPSSFVVDTNAGDLSDKTDDKADIRWVPSEDAVTAGCTYTLTFNGTEVTTDIAGSATVDLKDVEYGTYDVVLTTYNGSEVVNTQTIKYHYTDPYTVTGSLNVNNSLWEKFRWQTLTWDKIGAAKEYAIYADGVLIGTTSDTTYNVDAYNYANNETELLDKNGDALKDAEGNVIKQKTTVGDHTVSVVAIFEGETAPENYADVNTDRVITDADGNKVTNFNINLNYIYGKGTNIWNDTGVDSVWNFTVSEVPNTNVTDGAAVLVDYDTDGAANLTIVDKGTTTKDQPWTIKAAIYDEVIGVGNTMNLSFDILGPAELARQKITIKCVSDEVSSDGIYTGADAIYEEKAYTFEAIYAEDGETVIGSVIHYSNTFTSRNETYDLLFGLGELEPTTLTFTNAEATKMYGVTSVSASGIVNTEDTTNNNMYISWESNVPDILKDYYTYTVKVYDAEGNVVITKENATSGTVYKDYNLSPGTYRVEVSSIYDGTVTATEETTATIDLDAELKPDLVVSDISIQDPSKEYRVGDKVTFNVTMTNIGSKNATVTEGNITMWLRVHNPHNDTLAGVNYYTVDKVDGTATLAEGESVTKSVEYTITADHCLNDYLFTFTATADDDGKVDESNENNNKYSKTFMFNPALKDITFANDGTDISASWAASDDTLFDTYRIEYTNADGEAVTVHSTTPSITLPDRTYFKNDSEVKVTVECTDGTDYLYASGRARADLVIESMNPVDGVALVGEKVSFVAVVRNIGVAPATSKEGFTQEIAVTFTSGPGSLNTFYASDYVIGEDNQPIYKTVYPNDASTIALNSTYVPTAAGKEAYSAVTDDINRILESNDTDGTGVNNNTYSGEFIILNPSELALNLNEPEGEDSYVSATWTDVNILETSNPQLTVEDYQITYTNADGETKTVDVGTTNTYKFTEELQNNTPVIVKALYTEYKEAGYIQIAKNTALADLTIVENSIVIKKDGVEVDNPATEREYQISFTFKNIGTASVPAAYVPEDNPQLEYGKWILGNLQCSPSEGFECVATPANYSTKGIVAGASDIITYETVVFNKEGDYTLTANIDYPGHEEAAKGGYITESNEENNSRTRDITVSFVQNTEMDWTRFTVEGGTDPYLFPVASGSQKAYIDYKILTTTETNYHYEDIINKYIGYQGANMSVGFEPSKSIVYFNGGDGTNHSYTKFEFAQVPNWSEFAKDSSGKIIYDGTDENGNPIPVETTPDANSNELVWITLPDKASTIHDVSGTEGNLSEEIIATDVSDSPMGYNGNGYNFFVGNFGLYKCYLMKFTTPVPKLDEFGNYTYDEAGKMLFEYDEAGNLKYDEMVVAFRVTDDKIRTNNWMQALASDGVSNPNALPIPYCGGDSFANGDEDGIVDTNKDIIYAEDDASTPDVNEKHKIVDVDKSTVIDDTSVTDKEHEATEASKNYETIGGVWYDASDILLSSISVYNGNWLSISTSEYLEISKGDQDNGGTKNMRVGIARATVDPEQNNKFVGYATDFVVTDPNKSNTHLGIQGTNTVHVGLPWLLEELPTHSDDGGKKDVEYYWIRVWADINDVQETVVLEDGTYQQLANYIDIPITVYYDVPQIQPAQNLTAITSYDDNDQEIFSLSWGALAEMNNYGYKYKVFYTDANDVEHDISLDLAKSSGLNTTGYAENAEYYFDTPQALTSDAATYDAVATYDKDTNTVIGKLKVVAYWCEQAIPVEVDIQPPHKEGWYSFDGEPEINISAGQSKTIEMNGYMSYYYNRSKNHSSGTIGYNGYYVSINGNTRWFASNSKVSVAAGSTNEKFVSRTDMKTNYYDNLYTEVNAEQDATTGGLAKTTVDAKEKELGLQFKEIENPNEDGYVAGQLQIEAKTLFQATNLATWYLIKVETPILENETETGNVRVSYIMAESLVEVGGDVAVRGYQMNTDATPGGVSEFSPSFRVVSRASKLVADPEGQKLYQENGVNVDLGEGKPLYKADGTTINSLVSSVVARGTIYGSTKTVTDTQMEISVRNDEDGNIVVSTDEEAGVYQIPTTAGGVLTNWSGSANDTDKDAYTYYAVTFKPMNYSVKALQDEYCIKAYAVTEDGTIMYENTAEDNNPVKKASVYKIAKVLYNNGGNADSNAKMLTKEDHELLYNNVLNIVSIFNNYKSIGQQMLKKLGIKDKTSAEYKYINNAYKDLYYYAHLARNYEEDSYIHRGTFISKTLVETADGEVYNEELLLPLLNENTSTSYATVADWIYNEIDRTIGFYEKVEYVTPDTDGTVDAGTQQ